MPCVVFRNSKAVERANNELLKYEQISRIEHFKRSSGGQYKRFTPRRNYINNHDIVNVEKSKYAFPVSIVKQIKNETCMGWTAFAAKMKDGRYFGFGTASGTEFFQMPENYCVEDIDTIINNSYVLKKGELRSYAQLDDYNDSVCYRECPFFECYIDDL